MENSSIAKQGGWSDIIAVKVKQYVTAFLLRMCNQSLRKGFE